MPVRVLLVDDHPLVRSGLRTLLETEEDIEVVGEAADGAAAITATRHLRPDVVLMDLRMPGMDGIEATRHLASLEDGDEVKVLVVTMFDLDADVVEAVRAGARGYLLKGDPPERLIEAVHEVAMGGAMLGPTVTRQLLEAARGLPSPRTPASPAPGHALSDREEEVLGLLALGLSNAEIAARLAVVESTVKSHVSSILAKLGLRDRVQAVVYAYRHGLATTDPEDG